MKPKEVREVFVLDYIKLCTLANIKADKIRPFLQKHCRQSGTLPQLSTLCKVYVPCLFEWHYLALGEVFKSQSVSMKQQMSEMIA